MNVQHIESLNDQIWRITGIQVRETVPDGIVRQAAEIVAVDVTPDALLNRLEPKAIYKTKRRYQLGMTDQVRQAVEKANEKVHGRKKVLRFYDGRPDAKKGTSESSL
jgi:K+-sensing histidine kinase KdpD